MPETSRSGHAGLAVFRHINFTFYEVMRFSVVTGLEMQSVAVGWQVYEITRRPLDLGLVGLAQFLPNVVLFLLAGHAADRFSRKKVLLICIVGFALCSAILIGLTQRDTQTVKPIYGVLVLLGIVRSFNAPAGRSLLPLLVPPDLFPSAVAVNATTFQAATILGPAIGGLLYALFHGPAGVYATSVVSCAIGLIALAQLHLQSPPRARAREREEVSLRTVLAGLHYIRTHKVILGSISLDLFAVLLGGSVS